MPNNEEISGEFACEHYVFQDGDDENRTVIASLMDGTTIKGRARRGDLKRGLTYRIMGRWTQHPKYGKQFHFDSFCLTEPASARGIYLYLCQAQGIGPVIARQIMDKFGPDAIKTLRSDPAKVSEAVPALSLEKAQTAAATFEATSQLEATKVELVGLLGKRGFPKSLSERCIDRWGLAAPQRIREDPYSLTTFSGVGFLLADRLYLELGGDPGSIQRQGMCLWHAARSDTEGHTWHEGAALQRFLSQSVAGAALKPAEALAWAVDHDRLVTRPTRGGIWAAERNLAAHEVNVANCLHQASFEQPGWPAIAWSDKEDDRLPTRHQWEELKLASMGPIGILGGSPGTGKTYTIGHLIQAIGANPMRIAVCAPTGKAAVRATESLASIGVNLQATTIHSLLGVLSADGGWTFAHDQHNPLDQNWIIVDESSMIDIRVMSALLAARGNAQVLFVGDPDQLSPVGPGAPLRDMIAAGLPFGHLKEIHRNAGTIPRACAAIRDKGQILWDEKLDRKFGHNLVHVECERPDQTIEQIRRELETAAEKSFDRTWDVQVLCPINHASPLGRRPLNEMLQHLLNPHGEQVGDNPFRIGDKIVCTQNGDLPDANNSDVKTRVMNGEMGRVLEVQPRYTVARIFTPDREVRIPRGKSDRAEGEDDTGTGCNFELGYALSVHKSQGSEFPVCLVVIDSYAGARRLCDKHWLYTAISRAKQYCVTIGRKSDALEMCRKSHMWRRQTFLRQQIEDLRLAGLSESWTHFVEEAANAQNQEA